VQYQQKLPSPRGDEISTLATYIPLEGIEGVDRAVCIIHDITKIKQAEEKLRETAQMLSLLIDSSPVAIVAVDCHLNVQTWNPAAERLLGWTEAEILGKPLPIIPENRRETFRSDYARMLQGSPIAPSETQAMRKDGRLVDVVASVSILRNPEGEVTGLMGVLADVTERKRLEARLRQSHKMEAIGQLAGGVAHDFNNLLTIISGYAQLLLERASTEERSSVEEIVKAGERAASLTRQLLAFSRRQTLAPQVLDLNTLVANLEKMLRRLLSEDITLITMLEPGLGKVKADPSQIDQVLINLVVNARDAMPGGGRITIETANVTVDESYAATHVGVTPGPHVMLAVTDTGTGMDAETLSHVFEPFFTTKEKAKGTGLGLSTVYGTVRQSGGTIWAYSEPGHGTTMKIYLPRADQAVSALSPGLPAPPAKGSESVLVVEDDEAVRSLVVKALTLHSYHVLEAKGPREALALLEQPSPPVHLLLTDVVMPHMSGRTLAQQAARLRPGIMVLFISGYPDQAVNGLGMLEAGMPFLQKPFGPAELTRKVRQILDGEKPS